MISARYVVYCLELGYLSSAKLGAWHTYTDLLGVDATKACVEDTLGSSSTFGVKVSARSLSG